MTEIGGFDLEVPAIVWEGQIRLDGFDDRIIAVYALGLTTRDIRPHLRETYDVDVSPDLISRGSIWLPAEFAVKRTTSLWSDVKHDPAAQVGCLDGRSQGTPNGLAFAAHHPAVVGTPRRRTSHGASPRAAGNARACQ